MANKLPLHAVRLVVCCLSCWATPFLPSLAAAGCLVIGNHAERPVTFAIDRAGRDRATYKLAPHASQPIAADGPATIAFTAAGQPRYFSLQPGSVYRFVEVDERLTLETQTPAPPERLVWITPPGDAPASGAVAATTPHTPADETAVGVVRLKVLVDEDEVAQPAVWQARLRKRIAAASEIIAAHCRMRLEVEDFGTWTSDNRVEEFDVSLREFVAQAKPKPGQLAIGFSSQYAAPTGPTRLAGIPGPLFPYLLIREWPQRQSEPERLEVLVHELGHYLGAAHSAEPTSSVRPTVGDRQANARAFHIGYDSWNTLAVNLVSDQLRRRPIQHISQLPPAIKRQLAQVYLTLGRALPDDPAAWKFLAMLGAKAPHDEPPAGPSPSDAEE